MLIEFLLNLFHGIGFAKHFYIKVELARKKEVQEVKKPDIPRILLTTEKTSLLK